MKRFPIETAKLEKALKGAYGERKRLFAEELKTNPRDDDPWIDLVMQNIRALEPAPPLFDFPVVFERMFWRLAPAAVLMVCLLSIWLFQVDVTVEYDVASLLMTDPIGVTDISSLGL